METYNRSAVPHTDKPMPLLAGIARTDITPDKPVTLAGYCSRTGLCQGVHDPLSAREVAFEHAGRRLVLVSTDILGFYGGTAAAYRKAILSACGFQPSELLLSAIHTHSAPDVGIGAHTGHSNNVEYIQTLQWRLVEAVRHALAGMAPAHVAAASGSCPVGANRREAVTDGAGNTDVRLGQDPTGPTDREVQVLAVRQGAGRWPADRGGLRRGRRRYRPMVPRVAGVQHPRWLAARARAAEHDARGGSGAGAESVGRRARFPVHAARAAMEKREKKA